MKKKCEIAVRAIYKPLVHFAIRCKNADEKNMPLMSYIGYSCKSLESRIIA